MTAFIKGYNSVLVKSLELLKLFFYLLRMELIVFFASLTPLVSHLMLAMKVCGHIQLQSSF